MNWPFMSLAAWLGIWRPHFKAASRDQTPAACAIVKERIDHHTLGALKVIPIVALARGLIGVAYYTGTMLTTIYARARINSGNAAAAIPTIPIVTLTRGLVGVAYYTGTMLTTVNARARIKIIDTTAAIPIVTVVALTRGLIRIVHNTSAKVTTVNARARIDSVMFTTVTPKTAIIGLATTTTCNENHCKQSQGSFKHENPPRNQAQANAPPRQNQRLNAPISKATPDTKSCQSKMT
jgi:hypothetical protein